MQFALGASKHTSCTPFIKQTEIEMSPECGCSRSEGGRVREWGRVREGGREGE